MGTNNLSSIGSQKISGLSSKLSLGKVASVLSSSSEKLSKHNIGDPINNNLKNILLMKLSREQMELLGFREIIEPVQIYTTTENKSLGTCKFCAVLCINGCHKDSCIYC